MSEATGGNLDLDFIDYPTGWAIQKAGVLKHTDPRCSAVQTGGAMLCDCNALPLEWARLKTAHDGSDGLALAARYLTAAQPTTDADEGAGGEGHG